MTKQIPPAMRAAQPRDFDFCQRLYFENMSGIIDALNLDVTRQHASFARQWQVAEVRIITVADEGVGWIQVAAGDDDTMLSQAALPGEAIPATANRQPHHGSADRGSRTEGDHSGSGEDQPRAATL
jgi:hypothetical protein